jgi:DNA-binding beta-propeller fold protein YncE
VDVRSLAETHRIEVPNEPVSLALDRSGLRAYLASRAANTITVIDLVARRAVRTASVDAEPVRVQLDAAQATLWVLYEGSPYLDGIDVRSLETKTRLNLGAGGTAFRIEPRTGRLLVARRDGGGIDVYDPLSRLPVDTISATGRIAHLAIDAESNALFAAIPDSATIGAFNLVGRAPLWSSGVGDGPAFLVVAGER